MEVDNVSPNEIALVSIISTMIYFVLFLTALIFLLLGLLSLSNDVQRFRPRGKTESENIAYSREW